MQRLKHCLVYAPLATLGLVTAFCSPSLAQEPASKPNILVMAQALSEEFSAKNLLVPLDQALSE